MTMQNTKAHRNGPHRSRKSRRAPAAQVGQAAHAEQSEMFSVSAECGRSERVGQSGRPVEADCRASDRQRKSPVPGRASFGSFARAQAHGACVPTVPAWPAGREVVPDSLRRFGLRRLDRPGGAAARPDESAPMGPRVLPGSGLRLGESTGEQLPPLTPRVISAVRPRTTAAAASRFVVPERPGVEERLAVKERPAVEERSDSNQRSASRVRRSSSVRTTLVSVRTAMVADAPAVISAERGTRRLQRARVTTRGHIAVVVLVATAIAGASALANASHAAPGAAAPAAASQDVLVHSGDTVESIASKFAPAADRADLVALIRAANGLSGSTDAPLAAGDYLIVPAR